MPLIPTTGGPQVGLAPLPRVVAPPAAFGGPSVEPVARFATGLAEQADQLYQQAKKAADQVAVSDATTAVTQLKTDLLHNPETGALLTRGKDALAAPPVAMEKWRAGVADIANGLASDEQRAAFANVVNAHTADIHERLTLHAGVEAKAYDRQSTDATIGALTNDAIAGYTDTAAIDRGVGMVRALVADWALRNGAATRTADGVQLDPSAQAMAASAISQIHEGVVSRLIANDQDVAAQQYLEAHRAEILPSVQSKLDQHLDVANARGEGMRQADAITARATSLGAAMTEAAKISDPRVREATEHRLRQHFADIETNRREQQAAAFQRAGGVVERTKDATKVPPGDWLKLSVAEREALTRRADELRNPKRHSDPDRYIALVNMATLSDATKAQFSRLDLTKERDNLSDADFNRVVRLQEKVRREVAGDAKKQQADEKVTAFLSGGGAKPKAPGAPITPTAAAPSASIPPQIPASMHAAYLRGSPAYRAYLDSAYTHVTRSPDE